MLGTRVTDHFLFNSFWIIWAVIGPIILLVSFEYNYKNIKKINLDKSLKALTVLALMSFKGLESNDYKYPYWSTIIGIILSSSTLYGIIMYAIYYIVRYVIIGKQVR